MCVCFKRDQNNGLSPSFRQGTNFSNRLFDVIDLRIFSVKKNALFFQLNMYHGLNHTNISGIKQIVILCHCQTLYGWAE